MTMVDHPITGLDPYDVALEETSDPVEVILSAAMRGPELIRWLLHCGDVTALARLKGKACEIESFARRPKLTKMTLQAAIELRRRAERGLAQGIREGQRAGVIESLEESRLRGLGLVTTKSLKPKASDYATASERSRTNGSIFDLADHSDEEFEKALAAAREAGNLSRAHVVRTLRGETLESKTGRPKDLRGSRYWNSNRIVAQTIQMSGLDDEIAAGIDYAALDRDSLQEWIDSLAVVIRSLQSLKKKLTKELNP